MQAVELPLRDIHLPAAPGWWPPAPGWWLLAVLVLGLLWLGLRQLHRHWQHRRTRRVLLRELVAWAGNAPAPVERLARLSQFLRRVCKRDAPEALCLTGEDWLHFLDGDDPRKPFSVGPGRLLLDGHFRPRLEPAEVDAVFVLVRQRLRRWQR